VKKKQKERKKVPREEPKNKKATKGVEATMKDKRELQLEGKKRGREKN
jgi:hypothetical protein